MRKNKSEWLYGNYFSLFGNLDGKKLWLCSYVFLLMIKYVLFLFFGEQTMKKVDNPKMFLNIVLMHTHPQIRTRPVWYEKIASVPLSSIRGRRYKGYFFKFHWLGSYFWGIFLAYKHFLWLVDHKTKKKFHTWKKIFELW